MTITVTMKETRCAGGAVYHTAGQTYSLADAIAEQYIYNGWATYVSGRQSDPHPVVATANLTGGIIKTLWVGTQAEYDAIAVKDANTQYNTDAGIYVGETLVSGGGGSSAIGGSISGATAGSVLFVGTGGVLAQNNAKLFWDQSHADYLKLIIGQQGSSKPSLLLAHGEPGGVMPNAYWGIFCESGTFSNNGTYYDNTAFYGWNGRMAQTDDIAVGMSIETKFSQGSGQPFGAEIHLAASFADGKAIRAFTTWIDRASPHTTQTQIAGRVDFVTSLTTRTQEPSMRIYENGCIRFWNSSDDPDHKGFKICNFGANESETGKGSVSIGLSDVYPMLQFMLGGAMKTQMFADFTDGSMTVDVNATTGYFKVRNGGIQTTKDLLTGAPTGGTAAKWKLGTVAAISPTAPNRTIEVDVAGTIYYLAAKTTNN